MVVTSIARDTCGPTSWTALWAESAESFPTRDMLESSFCDVIKKMESMLLHKHVQVETGADFACKFNLIKKSQNISIAYRLTDPYQKFTFTHIRQTLVWKRIVMFIYIYLKNSKV